MRLIDADALIGQYNKFALTAQTDYAEGVRDVINDINNAPTIEAVPKDFHDKTCEAMAKRHQEEIQKMMPKRGEWILCSERLPKESEQDNELGVLVTLGNGYRGIQFDWVRDGEHWYDWDGYVIAWMPLPTPYGERREL